MAATILPSGGKDPEACIEDVVATAPDEDPVRPRQAGEAFGRVDVVDFDRRRLPAGAGPGLACGPRVPLDGVYLEARSEQCRFNGHTGCTCPYGPQHPN